MCHSGVCAAKCVGKKGGKKGCFLECCISNDAVCEAYGERWWGGEGRGVMEHIRPVCVCEGVGGVREQERVRPASSRSSLKQFASSGFKVKDAINSVVLEVSSLHVSSQMFFFPITCVNTTVYF